jgi:hypothetical protein
MLHRRERRKKGQTEEAETIGAADDDAELDTALVALSLSCGAVSRLLGKL